MEKSSKNGTLVVIAGPTGSGKTDVAVELAVRLGAPIISTDSRQVFRGMAIGTAQPDTSQLAAAKHYFIADRYPWERYNAGVFEAEATELLEELFRDNRYVIAVGGTGLYIDALCNGLDELPDADEKIRAELSRRCTENGLSELFDQLCMLDPAYAARIDRNNTSRVMRALEICLVTGKPYSSLRTAKQRKRNFKIVKIGIDTPREELYERINDRVDRMVDEGLIEEARSLYRYRDLNALKTVGYSELFEYFDGKLTLAQAVDLIKRNSRRYAKRQMTWFKRYDDITWFEKKDINSNEKFIEKFAE